MICCVCMVVETVRQVQMACVLFVAQLLTLSFLGATMRAWSVWGEHEDVLCDFPNIGIYLSKAAMNFFGLYMILLLLLLLN